MRMQSIKLCGDILTMLEEFTDKPQNNRYTKLNTIQNLRKLNPFMNA